MDQVSAVGLLVFSDAAFALGLVTNFVNWSTGRDFKSLIKSYVSRANVHMGKKRSFLFEISIENLVFFNQSPGLLLRNYNICRAVK